ncbi:MAG: hypothetical protein SOZ45_03720 [Ruminococcus sp.]|nr:hypothetical protein [Ruminococcus sp.]
MKDKLNARQKKFAEYYAQSGNASDIAKSNEELTPDRIRAIDTLNKMTGEYLNKVEVSGTLKAEQSKLDDLIKQMSEDE